MKLTLIILGFVLAIGAIVFSYYGGFKKEGYVMEIYDVPNKKIVYRKQLVN